MSDETQSQDDRNCAADGAWIRLDDLELRAAAAISRQLAAFESPFRDTYEAGVIVPVLRAQRRAVLDVRCAALFFKRVLNDFRGVWVLLRRGYTSQAAAIAASLYENALASICLTQSNDNISDFQTKPDGEIPWSPIEMAKMVNRVEGKKVNTKEFENGWRSLYAHYVWLCQIKHSTRQSVIHDTVASSLAHKHYVIMALPNIRDEDVPVKALVAIISLHRTLDSIEAIAKALGFKKQMPDDYKFRERFQRARELSWEAFKPYLKGPNPITISQSWFPKKYPPIR